MPNDPSLGIATEWVVLKCGMEPCTVMIRIQMGKRGKLPLICRWCQQGVAHWQRGRQSREVA